MRRLRRSIDQGDIDKSIGDPLLKFIEIGAPADDLHTPGGKEIFQADGRQGRRRDDENPDHAATELRAGALAGLRFAKLNGDTANTSVVAAKEFDAELPRPGAAHRARQVFNECERLLLGAE